MSASTPPPGGGYGDYGSAAPPPPPGYGGGGYGGTPPPNYLVWSILSTLFCCLPLGIAAIVFSAQVNSKFAAGDVAGAQAASKKAKTFTIWSAGVGLAFVLLYIVLIAAGAVSMDSTTAP